MSRPGFDIALVVAGVPVDHRGVRRRRRRQHARDDKQGGQQPEREPPHDRTPVRRAGDDRTPLSPARWSHPATGDRTRTAWPPESPEHPIPGKRNPRYTEGTVYEAGQRGRVPETAREGIDVRKLSVLVGLITLTLGLITPARAATPGALSQAQASAACAAFFGVTAGPEPLSACQWDMRDHRRRRRLVRERHRRRREGRRDRRRRRLHPSRPRRRDRRRAVVLVHLQRHADGRPAGDRQR